MSEYRDPRVGGGFNLKFVDVDVSLLGDNSVIAAVSGKRIVIFGYYLTNVLAILLKLQGSVTPKPKLASFDLAANGNVSYAGNRDCPAFWSETGHGIELNLSLATGVKGHMAYAEIV